MLKYFFGYLYWFQIFKNQCFSVPSIPVAYPWIVWFTLTLNFCYLYLKNGLIYFSDPMLPRKTFTTKLLK